MYVSIEEDVSVCLSVTWTWFSGRTNGVAQHFSNGPWPPVILPWQHHWFYHQFVPVLQNYHGSPNIFFLCCSHTNQEERRSPLPCSWPTWQADWVCPESRRWSGRPGKSPRWSAPGRWRWAARWRRSSRRFCWISAVDCSLPCHSLK